MIARRAMLALMGAAPAAAVANGYIVQKVQLGDDSPVIHGIHLVGNQMYCCDDLGWMWRFQI